MNKWILSFLILLLVMPAIPTSAHYEIIGYGGGPPYSPYSFSKSFSTSGLVTKPGCTLGTANWWSGVSLYGTSLRILCNNKNGGNNVSTSSVYFNVTFYLKWVRHLKVKLDMRLPNLA